ncbi:hypothetical protein [Chitinophaga varians]|uniref:hypothetical protein n=1 Tax=Chitinophaga varians TaxID=2202339 RepID=UPI00165EE3AD|nr:hypothetical protein [Chitinophaga varians]MBC9911298.1 hypothetical protein [Chitinophaga varians]
MIPLKIKCLITVVICFVVTKVYSQSPVSTNRPHSNTAFHILNIDSIQEVYIIYATRNDSTIKIVSKKENIDKCDPILTGRFYDLNITSLLWKTAGKMHIGGIMYNHQLIKLEGGKIVRDLFTSDNLKGLCYIP